ncbi:MAG: efflux RND transporter periplasmic adaptor subunit [Bacteroidia bacterium]|nr:efflux RND transporter periplasmic adaptor subunit [Bacteroidia bacterium]
MKKVFRIIGIVLLIGVVVATFVFLWKKSQPEKEVFETVSPSIQTIEKKTLATGKIQPRDEVAIKPQISGIIVSLEKEAGEIVKKGDIIAKVRVVPEMGALNSAETNLKKSKIALEKAQSDYNRQERLYKKGVVSQSDFEDIEVNLKNAKENLIDAQNSYDIIKDGITKNSANSSNTLIRATVDGTILDVPQKVGNSVIQSNTFNDGTTIATIANMGDMLFVGKIDETEVGKLKEGMPIKLLVGALEGRLFDADLEYIAPKGTEENGAVMFEIKAAVDIPDDVFIRAGYSANAQIVLAKSDSVMSIPESSLKFSGDSTYVEVRSTKDTLLFEKRPVVIGLSDGLNIEIKQGLQMQDIIKK